MAGRSFGEEVSKELEGKAVMWGPAIVGALLLGPVGIALGLAASFGILFSDNDSAPPPGGDKSPEH
jgi:hypothetical protein